MAPGPKITTDRKLWTRLDPETHEALRRLAREQDRSLAWTIREACRQYVNRRTAAAARAEAS